MNHIRRLFLIVQSEKDGWQFLRGVWNNKDRSLLHDTAHQTVLDNIEAHPECDYRVQFNTYHTAPRYASNSYV